MWLNRPPVSKSEMIKAMEKDELTWKRSPDILGPKQDPVNRPEAPVSWKPLEGAEETPEEETPDAGTWKRSPVIRPNGT